MLKEYLDAIGGGELRMLPEIISNLTEPTAESTAEPVEGEVYKGKITGIHQFGVFVEILPGAEDGSYPGLEGLCHVSELHTERVRNCEGFMNSMGIEEMEVKYLGKNNKGKLQHNSLCFSGRNSLGSEFYQRSRWE